VVEGSAADPLVVLVRTGTITPHFSPTDNSPTGGGNGFVFNMGGGPGMRVHQMGGNGPRRRPHNHANQPPASPMAALQSLLPLLLLFIIPLLSSLFSGGAPTFPITRFDKAAPYTQHHASAKLNVDYYFNPKDTADYTKRNWRDLDSHVENKYIQRLGSECEWESSLKQRARQEARGFWSRDEVKWQRAEAMGTPWGLTVGY
jgi:DnaJ family protein B protein 12